MLRSTPGLAPPATCSKDRLLKMKPGCLRSNALAQIRATSRHSSTAKIKSPQQLVATPVLNPLHSLGLLYKLQQQVCLCLRKQVAMLLQGENTPRGSGPAYHIVFLIVDIPSYASRIYIYHTSLNLSETCDKGGDVVVIGPCGVQRLTRSCMEDMAIGYNSYPNVICVSLVETQSSKMP
jgi:hypothetical protein